jgi:DNA polymerase (family 10)
MENKAISRTFRLLSQLMELHQENPFKIKSVANAAFKIDKLPFPIHTRSQEEIEQIDGLGKSMSAKVWELLTSGSINDLENIKGNTPPGIVEMLGIKGVGPKKILVIWKDLGIESIGELYYACNENRLIEAKGFGLKTQDEIIRLIEFKMAAEGKFLYAQAEHLINALNIELILWINEVEATPLLKIAGAFRRCCEIIEEVDFVLATDDLERLTTHLSTFQSISFIEIPVVLPIAKDLSITDGLLTIKGSATTDGPATTKSLEARTPFGLKIRLHLVNHADFYLQLFKLTGNETHVNGVLELSGDGPFSSEEEIYAKAGLSFVEPELREGLDEISLAKSNSLPELITVKDLKGSLHNHSTWSDGVHTLEQMAAYCKEELHLQYLGICDHSKSAFYANGLNEQRVYAQHQEIEKLNLKLAPFKIFKGIESDILNDGSLDYPEEILKSFDFVVASVHSNLRMTEEKATNRLIKAIENPYTTILGHPTGRLLLSRKGYPIDFKKVIDACASNHVVIEINANPLRLDLDWRWHRYALEKGVILSINPDAHRMEGFKDMHYGTLVARKGGLTASKCLNAYSLAEIATYFEKPI